MEKLEVRKMTKEESLTMLRLEKSFMGDNVNEDLNKLYDIVEQSINNETITYQDFVDDVISYLSNANDDDSTEDRSKFIKDMCNSLIKKYGRKEE